MRKYILGPTSHIFALLWGMIHQFFLLRSQKILLFMKISRRFHSQFIFRIVSNRFVRVCRPEVRISEYQLHSLVSCRKPFFFTAMVRATILKFKTRIFVLNVRRFVSSWARFLSLLSCPFPIFVVYLFLVDFLLFYTFLRLLQALVNLRFSSLPLLR